MTSRWRGVAARAAVVALVVLLSVLVCLLLAYCPTLLMSLLFATGGVLAVVVVIGLALWIMYGDEARP